MIVLVGFMGAGKSTVGRQLAARTGLPFVDSDAALVERLGMPIPDYFTEHGETAFRDAERRTVLDLLHRHLCAWFAPVLAFTAEEALLARKLGPLRAVDQFHAQPFLELADRLARRGPRGPSHLPRLLHPRRRRAGPGGRRR